MSDALILKNFIVLRSGIPLFKPVSLSLEKGKACEILGPNGIGKTSFLESLAGFNREIEGEVSFCDSLGSSLCDSFLYVSTKVPFEPQETVQENLSFWQAFWKVSQKNFENALEIWKVKSLLKLPYLHLSQGQQQRVNLVRLSLKKADLWLVDEPLSNLDQDGCSIFKAVLDKHLKQQGQAFIATHHVLGYADKITLEYCVGLDNKDAA